MSTCQFQSISSYAFCAISEMLKTRAKRNLAWNKTKKKKNEIGNLVILCCDIECSFHYLYIRQKIELTHHVPCGVFLGDSSLLAALYIKLKSSQTCFSYNFDRLIQFQTERRRGKSEHEKDFNYFDSLSVVDFCARQRFSLSSQRRCKQANSVWTSD